MAEIKMTQRKLDGYIRLSEIINWGRMYPVKFVEKILGIELLDYQKYAFMQSWTTKNVLWCMSRNAGKLLPLNTRIPTPSGDKTMYDIKIGDIIFDRFGEPTKVLSVSDIDLNPDSYEIEFEDGEIIKACADHQWLVYDRNVRECCDRNNYIVLQTKDMFGKTEIKRNDGNKEYRFRVPLTEPLQYEKKDFKLHPYILGLWLGDGSSHNTCISCDINDIKDTKENIEKCGHGTDIYYNKNRTPHIRIDKNTGTVMNHNNHMLYSLRELNLIKNKHIPEEYFYGSVEQRLDLLCGLMDSDGTVDKIGRCEFSQKDYNLIKQVSKLLDTLGIKNNIKSRISTCNGKNFNSYRINFRTDKTVACFKLKRKLDRLVEKSNDVVRRKAIISIKHTSSTAMKCITVDNKEGTYLFGEKNTVTHNTFLTVPFIMCKSMLIPNFNTFILAGTASQSQNLFLKIEKTAKKEIESLTGLTDVFVNEVVRTNSTSDGFIHEQSQYKCTLFNGSVITSLSGAYDRNRGYRSNLNVYDEGGFSPAELFEATKPFTTQDSNFKLGGDIELDTLGEQFPNQLLYASSASSVDTYFFNLYKDFSKKMFMGDRDYFVADINSEVVMTATVDGKIYPVALLTQSVIDEAMRINPEAAQREYKNIFTKDGGDQQVIKRASIIRCSKNYVPEFIGKKGKKFALAYDPARSYDNSVVTAGEMYWDDNVGYRMKLVNCVSFADIMKKKHTPIRTPEQIEELKKMIIDYNGANAADYENISKVLIDSGSGGGGVIIADYLMPDWIDSKGIVHRGIIDKEISADYMFNFPNTIDSLKLLAPSKYKKEMFEALIEMINLGLIDFPEAYDGKEFISSYDEKGNEIQRKLSEDEKLALIQMDLLKEELVNIYRFESSNGNCRYDLAPNKENKMHDDRCYTMAMLAWHLQQLRRENIVNRKSTDEDIDVFMAGYANLF